MPADERDKRFTITYSGSYHADDHELFPDEPPPPTGALAGLLCGPHGPTMREFFDDWNYAPTVTVTIIDNTTGETWVRPAGESTSWRPRAVPA